MTNPSAEAALAAASYSKAGNVPLIFDPNLRVEGYELSKELRQSIREAASLSDVVLLSGLEARIITGHAVPQDAAASVLQMGAGAVVVKLGPDGCLVVDSKDMRHVPAYRVEAIDSTGAGDGFTVGFIWGLLNKGSLDEAASIGNYVGAQVVRFRGARRGLPRLQCVLDYVSTQREHAGRDNA